MLANIRVGGVGSGVARVTDSGAGIGAGVGRVLVHWV